MPRRDVKKISLADLIGEGRANADLHKDDPEKRKNHTRYRVNRDHLITPKGGEYKRRLSGDAGQDIRLHEVAREFINNGFKQTKAYASVMGKTITQSRGPASKLFNSAWMRSMIHEMLRGTDGELAELPKEYLLEKLQKQIEANVLDYIDNDGSFLNVKELKALPMFVQQVIKKLQVHTWHEPLMETDEAGDRVEVGQIRHQRVQLELYDKQKALELLAKAQKWIAGDSGDTNVFLNADVMISANKRVEKLRREDIEGKYEDVTPD